MDFLNHTDILSMEKVKVFATPEAYTQITDSNNEEHTKFILNNLHQQITKKKSREIDTYDSRSSLGISAQWAKDSSKTSVVLIYHSYGILGLKHLNYPNTFWEDISKAIPIEID
jgi:hypothetical protein